VPRNLTRFGYLPLVAAAAILLYAGRSLPEVGDPGQPAATHVSPRYIEKSQEETGAANMVTAVLADYRGYDTLGETVVIFTAGLACLLVLGTLGEASSEGSAEDDRMAYSFGSDVVDVSTRLLIPFIFLFAAYVVVHGHTSPGGGFQGGAILGAALIVIRLVRGRAGLLRLDTRRALVLASLGVVTYAAIGLACLAFSGNFLDYGALPLPMESAHVRELATLGVEIGVFFGVTAVLLLIFESLTTGAGE
jgi:multicomponent Na+:H+ antiporter subunit B